MTTQWAPKLWKYHFGGFSFSFQCVVCISAKASMQTYPCGHKVVCRKCFVKTIQMAVSQRSLPLRCVVCRAKILRLKQSTNGGSSNCSTRSLSQSTSNSSQLSTYSSATSTSSTTSSTSTSSSSSSSTQSSDVPHECGSQRRQSTTTTGSCATNTTTTTSSSSSTSSSRKVKLLTQHHHRHKQSGSVADDYDDHDDENDKETVSIRKLSTSILPTNRDHRSSQSSLRSPAAPGGQTTDKALNTKCVGRKEMGKDGSQMKSSRQSMTIKDYIVSSPDIIYFKSPKKDRILGNRRNLLKPSHKLPSLPKVTVRSRASYKYLKKFETIME